MKTIYRIIKIKIFLFIIFSILPAGIISKHYLGARLNIDNNEAITSKARISVIAKKTIIARTTIPSEKNLSTATIVFCEN